MESKYFQAFAHRRQDISHEYSEINWKVCVVRAGSGRSLSTVKLSPTNIKSGSTYPNTTLTVRQVLPVLTFWLT